MSTSLACAPPWMRCSTISFALLLVLTSCQSAWVHEEIDRREHHLYGESPRPPEGLEDPAETPLTRPKRKEGESDLTAYIRFGLGNNAGLRSSFDKWRGAWNHPPANAFSVASSSS